MDELEKRLEEIARTGAPFDMTDDALRTFLGIVLTHYIEHKEPRTPSEAHMVEGAERLLLQIREYERAR